MSTWTHTGTSINCDGAYAGEALTPRDANEACAHLNSIEPANEPQCATIANEACASLPKVAHGGPGRNQGRKPLSSGSPTVAVSVKMTVEQKAAYRRKGGAVWVRNKIDESN